MTFERLVVIAPLGLVVAIDDVGEAVVLESAMPSGDLSDLAALWRLAEGTVIAHLEAGVDVNGAEYVADLNRLIAAFAEEPAS